MCETWQGRRKGGVERRRTGQTGTGQAGHCVWHILHGAGGLWHGWVAGHTPTLPYPTLPRHDGQDRPICLCLSQCVFVAFAVPCSMLSGLLICCYATSVPYTFPFPMPLPHISPPFALPHLLPFWVLLCFLCLAKLYFKMEDRNRTGQDILAVGVRTGWAVVQ